MAEKSLGEGLHDRLEVWLAIAVAAGLDFELALFYYLQELFPDAARCFEVAMLEKVFLGPAGGELVGAPELENVEEGYVVTAQLIKSLPRLGRLLDVLLVVRGDKNVLHREHGHNGEHLLGAAMVQGGHHHAGQVRGQGEEGHALPDLRDGPVGGKRPEEIELLHRRDNGVLAGRVHKVKVEDVPDPHFFQAQNRVSEAGPLDLRDGLLVHGLVVVRPREEAVTLARRRAPRATCSLFRRGLGDWGDNKGVHRAHRLVSHLLDEPRVHHVPYAIHSHRGGRNVLTSGKGDMW